MSALISQITVIAIVLIVLVVILSLFGIIYPQKNLRLLKQADFLKKEKMSQTELGSSEDFLKKIRKQQLCHFGSWNN